MSSRSVKNRPNSIEEASELVEDNEVRKVVLYDLHRARHPNPPPDYSYKAYVAPLSSQKQEKHIHIATASGDEDTSSSVELVRGNVEDKHLQEFAMASAYPSLAKQGTLCSVTPGHGRALPTQPPIEKRCRQQMLIARRPGCSALFHEVSCIVGPRIEKSAIREETAEQLFGFKRPTNFDAHRHGDMMIGDKPTQGVGVINLPLMLEDHRDPLACELLVISNESFVPIDCIFSEYDFQKLHFNCTLPYCLVSMLPTL